MSLNKFKRLIWRINWYPPYWAAGIRLKQVNEDFTRFEVQMKMRWYNRNLVGTHFGGSLYSMCDPFYMFILLLNLGKEYIVWDKSASIDFVRPGKGTVKAIFEILPERIEEIRADVQEKGKNTYFFSTKVYDEAGETVALVNKVVYVRVKSKKTT